MVGSLHKSRRNLSILPHLIKRQITGLPLSRLKDHRRCTARLLNKVVKPKRLADMVESGNHFVRCIFLGFLKGTYWFVSYSYLQDPTNPLEVGNATFATHGYSNFVLEFWLYHPDRPLELRFTRNLFSDLNKGWLSYPEDMKFTIYQWIEKPDHILAFGERMFTSSNSCGDCSTLLSITYLPVPSPLPTVTCPMCLKGKSSETYSCVVHDCLLDFFGSVEGYQQTKTDKHLRIPNTMYLNICGQKLYCVSMSHPKSADSWHHYKDRHGNLVSNIRTTVYSGIITDNSHDVKGVSDPCDDFTMNCTTTGGKYYLPVNIDDPELQSLEEDTHSRYLVVKRSWIDLQLLIIDEVYPVMCEKTSWFNSNCVLKDWTAEYIEICAETGAAICEMAFKVGEDPRFFDPLDEHICSVTFAWEVQTGNVEITQFDEGVLIHDEKAFKGESTLLQRARNPLWVSKLRNKYKQPCSDKSVIELGNLSYMRGESLTKLISMDRTAIITL